MKAANEQRPLVITEVFPPQVGGSGRWVFEVYRRLPAEVVVAAGEHPAAAVFDESHSLTTARMGLAFDSWGFFEAGGFKQYWKAARRLMRLAREHRATAVHCGKALPEGWLAWMLKMRLGLPYWVYVHGEELRLGQKSRQLGWLMRRVYRGASGLVANSHNTARLLARDWKLPSAKVHVVHPGVDAEYFVPTAVDAAFRERMGWAGRRVVLTVGRLDRRKGHDMLIRGLPRIRQRVPNVLYAIVGDGDERETLVSLAREMGVTEQVQFLGKQEEETLKACYQQCDLFVLPNRDIYGDIEGFGMVLVEAQACGRPVIAGASGGTAETLVEGRTGVTVNCEGPELLADQISEFLLDEGRREAMGRAGREWVLEHFDWPRAASEAAAVLIGESRSKVVGTMRHAGRSGATVSSAIG